MLSALVDTGADFTVVPRQAARSLRLPTVRKVQVFGVGGFRFPAVVSLAEVEIAGIRETTEVFVFGDEALVGRDLLNRWVATLQGPQQRLRVEIPQPKTKPR